MGVSPSAFQASRRRVLLEQCLEKLPAVGRVLRGQLGRQGVGARSGGGVSFEPLGRGRSGRDLSRVGELRQEADREGRRLEAGGEVREGGVFCEATGMICMIRRGDIHLILPSSRFFFVQLRQYQVISNLVLTRPRAVLAGGVLY